MTKIEFLFYLQEASFQALKFVENNMKTELKTNFRYNVIFAEPTNETICSEFDMYEDDCGKIKLDLVEEEVIDLLYRKDKLPIWIDMNVLKSSRKSTTFNLLCSIRYLDDEETFYYNHNNLG